MGFLTRMASTLVGTRIAAESGKAGLAGVAAGMLATRFISRSPLGALVVGGAYLGHKLWQKKKQIDAAGPHAVAVADGLAADDGPAAPPRPKGVGTTHHPDAETAAQAQAIGIGPPVP